MNKPLAPSELSPTSRFKQQTLVVHERHRQMGIVEISALVCDRLTIVALRTGDELWAYGGNSSWVGSVHSPVVGVQRALVNAEEHLLWLRSVDKRGGSLNSEPPLVDADAGGGP